MRNREHVVLLDVFPVVVLLVIVVSVLLIVACGCFLRCAVTMVLAFVAGVGFVVEQNPELNVETSNL